MGGESSAGKDYIVNNILDIFPKNRKISRTKITAQAFTYWHEKDKDWTWDGKILYLPDISENILNSSTFKVMATEGTIATIIRNQRAIDIRIKGIPNIVITTANSNPNNEILNRFSLLSLDESKEQTKNIMKFIASNEPIKNYDKNVLLALEKLERVQVIVPFAEKMVRFFPNIVKMRRIFNNFKNLVKASTALHQYQRKKDNEGRYIAIKQDYEIARSVIEYIRDDTISGLTAREKRYLSKFEEIGNDWISIPAIVNKTSGFATPLIWYQVMEKLAEKNVVILEEHKNSINGRFIKHFKKKLVEENKLMLPIFERL